MVAEAVEADGTGGGGGGGSPNKSALDKFFSSVKTTDVGIFQELPMKAGSAEIDHDRILEQIALKCEIRGYQRILAEPGLRGENNIVVLQTGE